jgi:predicted ATPase
LMGEVVDADAVLRRTLDFRDEDRESVARMSGRDAVIYALSVEAPLLWVLGKPDSALSTAEAAMDRGANSPRPYDRVVPHAFLLQVLLYRGEYELARQSGGLAVRVAEEQGIAHLLSDALVLTGWATARAASPDRGLELIRRGMDLRRAMGAKVGWSYLLSGYAEALHLAGETGAALEALEEAKTHASRSGQLVYLPEAHRLYGSIASSAGQAAVDAEEEFRRALEIAETQGARGYQLRAAISLAGLWRDRGKPIQARDLLAPVYESFAEGFDTADLKDAKALLDELA